MGIEEVTALERMKYCIYETKPILKGIDLNMSNLIKELETDSIYTEDAIEKLKELQMANLAVVKLLKSSLDEAKIIWKGFEE